MKKYLIRLFALLVVVAVGLGFLAVVTTTPSIAADASSCSTPPCGSPTVLKRVSCELVKLHFTQDAKGSVAIRLYGKDGAVIYDRYSSERAFIKETRDTYAICASLVRRAAKVTIARCIPEIATPLTYEGEVIRAFRESEQNPVRLP